LGVVDQLLDPLSGARIVGRDTLPELAKTKAEVLIRRKSGQFVDVAPGFVDLSLFDPALGPRHQNLALSNEVD
jgi:hypothetical protein